MTEKSFTAEQLKELIRGLTARVKGLPQARLLVVGDIGLDEYVMGEVRRISPEAPVPVLEVQDEESRLGLAANVAQNVASLGGVPLLIGVVGQDAAADELRRKLSAVDVSPEHLVVDATRPTTRKLRVMSGIHHIVRVDYERKRYVSPESEAEILAKVKKLVLEADAVIIEDYAKGMLSESVIQAIVQLAHAAGKKVFLDPNRSTPASFYRGVDVTTPNRDEAIELSGVDYNEMRLNPDFIVEVGRRLRERAQIETVIVTRGAEGMTLVGADSVVHLPTFAQQVFDVTGAGDTAIAALAMAYVGGFPLWEACLVSNLAAGVVVGKTGCVPCTREQILDSIKAIAEV